VSGIGTLTTLGGRTSSPPDTVDELACLQATRENHHEPVAGEAETYVLLSCLVSRCCPHGRRLRCRPPARLARRGSLVGLLFLPGTLFYALYWYVLYLTGAPFSVLFLVYVPLVTLSAFTIIGVVSSTDGEEVRRRLSATVLARAIGALLVVLGLLTLAQDTTGALVSALADDAPADPAARPVWISDLALQAPAVIVGGALLWRSSSAARPPRRTGWRNGRDEGAPEGDAMSVKHAPTLAYALSALLAGLLAFSSVAGVLYGSHGLWAISQWMLVRYLKEMK
jgi:hypothetical protein